MNILAIGNSFSQDATRSLYDIARADKEELTVVNLYIGGCPLSLHYRNMLSEEKKYKLQFDGHPTEFFVSIKDALLAYDWDYVTFQQTSGSSFDYSTYQPYLSELSAYVKKFSPKAKQVIHQAWAYEQGSVKLESKGYSDQADMYNDLSSSYELAAMDIEASMIIPSGALFQKLLACKIDKVHRDTYHAKLGISRYALGLLWYTMLTGKSVADNTFCDFDEQVTEREIALVKKCVTEIAEEYRK